MPTTEESRATSIVILSVRFMVSPPGSKAQPWHLDYSGTSANCQSVFVNISKSVKGNCTEYVEFESSEDEVKCIERARAALLKSGKQGRDWCRKKETKRSIVSLLRLVSFFLHPSLQPVQNFLDLGADDNHYFLKKRSWILKFSQFFPMSSKPQQNKRNQFVKIQNRFFQKDLLDRNVFDTFMIYPLDLLKTNT